MMPEDRNAVLHRRFTLLACGAFVMATLLFALATALNDRFPRRVPMGWLALTFVLLTWVLVGPLRLIHDPGLTIAITSQKILGIALLAIFALETYEAERFVAGGSGTGLIDARACAKIDRN
jgi:drug/metabolite transporter (DMT)-like permease